MILLILLVLLASCKTMRSIKAEIKALANYSPLRNNSKRPLIGMISVRLTKSGRTIRNTSLKTRTLWQNWKR